jgi:predicted ATP-dependent endonuclease of OLD family
MKLKMRRFDPTVGGTSSDGLLGFFIVLIGKRNSGKTTLLKDLCFHLKDNIDLAIAVSPTDEANEGFKTLLPGAFIFREPDEKHLDRIMDYQRQQLKKKDVKNLLLILDDCAFDRSFFNTKSFRQLAFNGRHLKITVILTLQYAISIPPGIRVQVDLVLQLNERLLGNRKTLFETFFSIVSFEEFCRILDRSTTGFDCLVLYNRSRSNNLADSFFWYAASPEDSKNARLMKTSFWKMTEKTRRGLFDDDHSASTEVKARHAEDGPAPAIGEAVGIVQLSGKTLVGGA